MARAAAHQTAAVGYRSRTQRSVNKLATADAAGEESGQLQGLPGLCWACPAGILATKLHARQCRSSKTCQGQQQRGGGRGSFCCCLRAAPLARPPACSHQAIHCCCVQLPSFSVPSPSCYLPLRVLAVVGEACSGRRMRLDGFPEAKGSADGLWPAPGLLEDASVHTFNKPTTRS